ncbi:transglycosylase SLT domain-containing protein [Streptomyces griseorubiginosus]|uniref:aggregation-promoting factor C-terminal-like domain-containing protein n=1 Tax=Streptomyces griseorubiginosus TaxID=67304 RepID=UPI001AD64534|nr:transglycosylase SLT domain-containing protein [Streptomyces griseorubiginosus]MBO4259813.1 transglycosylase SLT domain-containing protein [Streptomyces griseorubiginosus]
MSPISVRGFAAASATAVTAVGSVVGIASGSSAQPGGTEATAVGATLLADIPAGQQAQVQTESLTRQADAQAVQADASAKKEAEEAARKAAARTAVAKKADAEKAAKEAKERAETKTTSASSSSSAGSSQGGGSSNIPVQSSYTTAQIKAIAAQIVPGGQLQCFSNIVERESGWNYRAVNPSSGAYGLMQALPGSKMSSAGADWQTNPATQIKWGLNYMNSVYGSPCGAWTYWQANHAY